MKTIIKRSLQSLLLVPIFALSVGVVMPAMESSVANAQIRDGVNATGTQDGSQTDLKAVIKNIINVLLYIIGAISVIMIIFGGFKYITSGGDSSGVTSAKNTILYAVIGLIVAVLAYAIVNYVLTELGVV